MQDNAERLIEALLRVQMMEYQIELSKKKEKTKSPVVVTISRGCSSLGNDVGQALAAELDISCYDRYILQEVARRADVEQELVEALYLHAKMRDEHWWNHLLSKVELSREEYYENLLKTVIGISHSGGVIIGRGASHILGSELAFRVRITSSVQLSATRISQQENLSMEDAIRQVEEANKERAEYIRRLYDSDINDLRNYDLVLNAERFEKDQMVELILRAMVMAGLDVPAQAMQKLYLTP